MNKWTPVSAPEWKTGQQIMLFNLTDVSPSASTLDKGMKGEGEELRGRRILPGQVKRKKTSPQKKWLRSR